MAIDLILTESWNLRCGVSLVHFSEEKPVNAPFFADNREYGIALREGSMSVSRSQSRGG